MKASALRTNRKYKVRVKHKATPRIIGQTWAPSPGTPPITIHKTMILKSLERDGMATMIEEVPSWKVPPGKTLTEVMMNPGKEVVTARREHRVRTVDILEALPDEAAQSKPSERTGQGDFSSHSDGYCGSDCLGTNR